MYKEHPAFKKPKDENAKIWRYMDFTKFVSLLDKEQLFFTRADRLDDPFEGSCPEKVIKIWEKTLGMKYASGFYKHLKKFTVVNCWHLNEYESVAMWKLYLKSSEGIAIQSTFNRLRNSFRRDEDHDIFVGKVEYIDYEKYAKPEVIFMYPIMYKRKIFKHEQELRAVIRKLPKRGFSPGSKPTFSEGTYVLVDLDTLIERIFIAPATPPWQLELVKSISRKYGLNKEVRPSRLGDEPSLE